MYKACIFDWKLVSLLLLRILFLFMFLTLTFTWLLLLMKWCWFSASLSCFLLIVLLLKFCNEFINILFFFSVSNCTFRWHVILRSTLSEDIKTEYLRFIKIDFRRKNNSIWVSFHKDMWQWCSKVRAIDIYLLVFWQICFFASRTVNFQPARPLSIAHPYRNHSLLVTKSSWTLTECTL